MSILMESTISLVNIDLLIQNLFEISNWHFTHIETHIHTDRMERREHKLGGVTSDCI